MRNGQFLWRVNTLDPNYQNLQKAIYHTNLIRENNAKGVFYFNVSQRHRFFDVLQNN